MNPSKFWGMLLMLAGLTGVFCGAEGYWKAEMGSAPKGLTTADIQSQALEMPANLEQTRDPKQVSVTAAAIGLLSAVAGGLLFAGLMPKPLYAYYVDAADIEKESDPGLDAG